MAEESKHPSKRRRTSSKQNSGSDLIRKMDDFFQLKPSANILDTIDSFFQQSLPGKNIPVDLFETDKEWVVQVDLPGVNKEDINIDVVGDQLVISVSNNEDINKYDENTDYYQRERRYFHTERTVALPYALDKKTAKAKYRNGLLEIRGPKKRRSDYHLDIE